MHVTVGHAHMLGDVDLRETFVFDPQTSKDHLLVFEFESARTLGEEWSFPLIQALHDIPTDLHARVQLYVEKPDRRLVKREKNIWVDIYPGTESRLQEQSLWEVSDGPDGLLRKWVGDEFRRSVAWWDALVRRELRGVFRNKREQLKSLEAERLATERLVAALAVFA